jgi:hypothetical protein
LSRRSAFLSRAALQRICRQISMNAAARSDINPPSNCLDGTKQDPLRTLALVRVISAASPRIERAAAVRTQPQRCRARSRSGAGRLGRPPLAGRAPVRLGAEREDDPGLRADRVPLSRRGLNTLKDSGVDAGTCCTLRSAPLYCVCFDLSNHGGFQRVPLPAEAPASVRQRVGCDWGGWGGRSTRPCLP